MEAVMPATSRLRVMGVAMTVETKREERIAAKRMVEVEWCRLKRLELWGE